MRQRKTVLVTGATGGIGYEFGKIFSSHGYDVVLVARDTKALGKLAEIFSSQFHNNILCIPADLSHTDSPQQIYAQLNKEKITIDILVNNAGLGMYGDFASVEVEKHLELIQVNIVAVTALTRLLLPNMLKQKQGKILNVASTAAFQPGPHMAVYYATKAYVLSFSEALASELQGTGVSVTTLCPGPTKTGFETEAHLKQVRLFKVITPMDATTVAKAGYDGLMKGKTLVIPGFKNVFLAFGNRFVPRSAATRISKFTLE